MLLTIISRQRREKVRLHLVTYKEMMRKMTSLLRHLLITHSRRESFKALGTMTTVRPISKSDAKTCAMARTANVLECVAQDAGAGIGCVETVAYTRVVYSMMPVVDMPSRCIYQPIASCRLFTGLIVREVTWAIPNASTIAPCFIYT